MMCFFCGNRNACWNQMSDEELEMQYVKCDYADYVLDDAIELEELLEESERRLDAKREMEAGRNVG